MILWENCILLVEIPVKKPDGTVLNNKCYHTSEEISLLETTQILVTNSAKYDSNSVIYYGDEE